MERFMKKCYKCNTDVKPAKCVKDGISLKCMRCQKCGEEYFTSSELIKYDIKTGKREMIRKFGTVGDSIVLRLPSKVLQDYKIKPGDYGVFENRSDGILIKPVHAKDVN